MPKFAANIGDGWLYPNILGNGNWIKSGDIISITINMKNKKGRIYNTRNDKSINIWINVDKIAIGINIWSKNEITKWKYSVKNINIQYV